MTNVNTHIHTPYSFACFESVRHAVTCAKKENVGVLGISDFNTVDGFDEFNAECAAAAVYPLFNIEFIAFSEEDKKENKRWNDPSNPGVMYFCGKALNYPVTISDDTKNRLKSLWKGTQDQIWQVIAKLNAHCEASGVPLVFDYNKIRASYAKNTVRERHVARALADALTQKYPAADQRLAAMRLLVGNETFSVDLSDAVAVQNELRNHLLKTGKAAYVEENPAAFFTLAELKTMILDAGGIPCYPVLADDSRLLNEYESDVAALAARLLRQGIHAVEFIPLRNSLDLLKRYVPYFYEQGFCVSFGTEHNTPECISLVPAARGNKAFDDQLQKISWESACILAAHQQCHTLGRQGYVDSRGTLLVPIENRQEFISIGEKAINEVINNK